MSKSDETRLGAEVDLVPLYVSAAAAHALTALKARLQADPRLYKDCCLWLGTLQRTRHGPLTTAFAALVEVLDL